MVHCKDHAYGMAMFVLIEHGYHIVCVHLENNCLIHIIVFT
jgi:hypothetical protein